MMPFWWACCTAWQTVRNNSNRSLSEELLGVAVGGDGPTLDEFHDEIRAAAVVHSGVKDPRDVGMIHQGQGMPLSLEAGQDLPRIHARLKDLQRHLAADGLFLLGQVDNAESALPQDAEQLVGADPRAEQGIGWRSQQGRAGNRILRPLENRFDQALVAGKLTVVLFGRRPLARRWR